MPASENSAELQWRKSTFSGADTCVVVAPLNGGGAAVKDSKNPHSPVLYFNTDEWRAFVKGVEHGEFNFS